MIFEVCTENLLGAELAAKFKAKRIELCSGISLGGLTPSIGCIKQCVEFGKVEVHVLIRPRAGGFFYSKEEVEIIQTDIITAANIGAQGVVFGVLDENNEVSFLNKTLLELAKTHNLQVTFHRAFDVVSNMKIAIEKIIEMGFDRVLTSGLKENVFLGLENLAYLVEHYGCQIEIMAGGGVNHVNAKKIASVGIKNLHFTSHKELEYNFPGFGPTYIPNENKISKITSLF
ncbi:copper homeostasis protein CutC [Namhaeicola litoreus]|uniref:PF03932 family protein CutC n=1 Tax=Namhaeicola litoreus TaxID=1052145 RepID=A0ABW3Y520_9FLAO